jgi:hypothetical protein
MNALAEKKFVTILCPSSGLGLKKDALIIKRALDLKNIPNKITYVHFGYTPRNLLHKIYLKFIAKLAVILDQMILMAGGRKQHINIHLEVMMHRNVFTAPINVFIPNQEWSVINSLILEKTDMVWCKSKLSEIVFSEIGFSTRYIGFQTLIKEKPKFDQSRKREFFTRIGMTKTRGSDQLVELWNKHPEWPTLNMVIDESLQPTLTPNNVNYIRPIASDEEYFRLVNSFLFHIYVTEAEGFGHSIVESMSTGAIVLVTQAAPMNEYANDTNAIMIAAQYAGQMKLSPRFKSSNAQIEAAVAKALSMAETEIIQLRQNAVEVNDHLEQQFIELLNSAVVNAVKNKQVSGVKIEFIC